jgi:bacterioferritin-associated ferredoxin
MYVCVCQAVTDRQIREAAEGGARTLKDLRRDLGVTRDCGRCASCARQCLHEANAAQAKPGKALGAGFA